MRYPSKRSVRAAALALLVVAPSFARAQILSELTLPAGGNGRSQRAEVSQWIGPVEVTIAYHSPSVHTPAGDDRSGHIWGELVPYGLFDDGHGPSRATPWRAGANETTTITFSHDVRVEGKGVPAGTYGLFLLLAKDGPWSWILSRNFYGWGSYQYDPKDDVARLPVMPQEAPPTEFLTYEFEQRGESAAVAQLRWERKRVPLRIEVPDVNEVYYESMKRELQGWPGFDYQNWATAAQFCAAAKIHLDEALDWANRAIESPFRGGSPGKLEFSTLRTKAQVLEAMGRDAEAAQVMSRALHLPGNEVIPVALYGFELLGGGKAKQATDVFVLVQKQHPEDRYWSYVGLARSYAALGDRPRAIAAWKVALANVPDGQTANVPRFTKMLRDLESAASAPVAPKSGG